MKVAIYSRGLDTEQGAHLDILLEALTRYDVCIRIFQPLLAQFPQVTQRYPSLIPFLQSAELPDELDCLISLGGDGTLLDTVALVRNKKIPVLGVNFGRLGFLAGISRDELSNAVEA
ncbi:MAG: NAD(+) kinase, partial [Sediminibacterium sp.]|nr:NAD(+) kinase [Sediminibacterium sp.]